jgi:hypothetical protein
MLRTHGTLMSSIPVPSLQQLKIPSIFIWKKVRRHQGGPNIPHLGCAYEVLPAFLFEFRDSGSRASSKDPSPSRVSVRRFHLVLAHAPNLEGAKAKSSS